MAFRLPRLPRGEAIVDKLGMPLIALQRWWQSVVESLEDAEEAIEDLEVYTPARHVVEAADSLVPPALIALEAYDLAPPVVVREYDGLMEPPLGALMADAGTVLSVDASGGTTGLTFSGGPITRSGTLTLAGTLAVANGGTGATSAANARTNLGLVIGTDVQAYDADLTTWAGITPGTGVGVALAVNVGSAGAFVTFNGALGTPSAGTLTNCTGLPTAGLVDDAVTYAKIQNVSATDRLLGRSTAGAGDVEEITCTAAGRALLDDASASDQRTTLGLGTIATQAANNVAITGGTIAGLSSLGVSGRVTVDSGSFSAPAAGTGIMYGSATDGQVFAGRGTGTDLLFANKNGATVISVATGTTTTVLGGALTVPGNITLSGGGFSLPAAGAAAVYGHSTDGGVMVGRGSTNDYTLYNKDGAEVLRVPTGTQKLVFGLLPVNAVDDAAAAAAGVAVKEIYRNGSVLMVRAA